MRRERGEPERCCGAPVVSVQQNVLRENVNFFTRSRRVDADYATSEREAKRARVHVVVYVLRA
jgi:DNA-binding sugar fermentation-stimulating protein